MHTQVLMTIPAGRFPAPCDDEGGNGVFCSDIVLVCLLNKRACPTTDAGVGSRLHGLRTPLQTGLLWGVWGISFSWSSHVWQLASAGAGELTDDLLEAADLLPLRCSLPTTDVLAEQGWDPSMSWLGLQPAAFTSALKKLTGRMPELLREQFRALLGRSIMAGQHQTWKMARRLIMQHLSHRRRVARAVMLRLPPPKAAKGHSPHSQPGVPPLPAPSDQGDSVHPVAGEEQAGVHTGKHATRCSQPAPRQGRGGGRAPDSAADHGPHGGWGQLRG